MNLIGSRPTGWWRDRPAAMRDLVDELQAYVEATEEPVTVVFDGGPVQLDAGAVDVAFAPGGPDAADDEIAKRAARDEQPAELRVVTSDRELAERVREAGAEVVSVSAFRRRLDEARP